VSPKELALQIEPDNRSEGKPEQGAFSGLLTLGLPQRVAILAVLFTLELVTISGWLDTKAIDHRRGLTGLVGDWGASILRSVVAVAAVFVTFGYLKAKGAIRQVSHQLLQTPTIDWRFLAGHACALTAFSFLSALLFAGRPSGFDSNLIAASWLVAGVTAIALAGWAVVPPKLWFELVRSTGKVWVYALAVGIAAVPIGSLGWSLWKPASALTFTLVKALLGPFVSGMITNPAKMTIGTQSFKVAISPGCSGLEGVGLMLIFGILWLWFFRHECRFPQALLLIPAGVSILFLLNAVRIAVLILIGNAGAPQVAAGGFHSQAGWIAFNGVALGFSVAASRLPWLIRRQETRPLESSSAENPTAAYLVPFLLILAAAMVSRAATSGFEWLYPLRFFAAAAALWFFRLKYRELDWRFTWFAPAAGSLVFVIWLALDRVASAHTNNALAAGIASLPTAARITWLTFRTLAAVVTVPIAEELAFRGFLIRRLITSDFESIDARRFTHFSVLASSVAFGLLHGDRWLAGTVAGLLYAAALLRRGRIGDAVVAHATTNALLAAWVLLRGNWYLW
jgi:exosortase E/protease (VPEID-CTERM system)